MKASLCTLALFLIVILGCQSTKTEQVSSSEPASTLNVDSILKNLAQTPDSLRTQEDRTTLKKIHMMIAKYVELKDGEFSFNLSKEEFEEKTDLDIMYYDAIMRNIDENNSMKDEMDLREAEKDFKKTQEILLKEIKETESIN